MVRFMLVTVAAMMMVAVAENVEMRTRSMSRRLSDVRASMRMPEAQTLADQ